MQIEKNELKNIMQIKVPLHLECRLPSSELIFLLHVYISMHPAVFCVPAHLIQACLKTKQLQ
jgi:hypothetical protein